MAAETYTNQRGWQLSKVLAGEKKLEPRGYVKASLEVERENRMQNCSTANFACTATAIYWVVTPISNFTLEFWCTAAQIYQILTIKINVTIDFGCTAAEI